MVALSLRHWRKDKRSASYAILSACCLVAGAGTTFPGGDLSLLGLFSAAALLGLGLTVPRPSGAAVAKKRDLRGEALAVSRGSGNLRTR
jgi:hypothetical protein